MINWELLGIAPTTDKSTIKKAYRSRLADTNPEDKPEEFMALRQAYEEAVEYAAQPSPADAEEESGGPLSGPLDIELLPEHHPAHHWTRRLQMLYADFRRRIDPEAWKELLSDPICSRIDTAADVKDALLRFLMDWWFLPDEVIRALDDIFSFEDQKEKLFRHYPADFVDAVLLTPLHRQGGLEYRLFEGPDDGNYDAYINLYYMLTGLVGRRQHREAWQCIEEMESSAVFHPYLAVEKAKLYLSEEKPELAAEAMASVYPVYDSSATVCCMTGEVSLALEDPAAARQQFTRALEMQPASLWARIGLAEASLELKEYETAREWIDQVLTEDRYNPRGLALEEEIQAARSQGLKEKTAAGDAADKERLDLAVIYIDQGECGKAVQLLSAFTCDDRRDESDRLHHLATAETSLNDQEPALEHFRQSAEILRELLPVTSDAEQRKELEANLARTLVMESVCLEELDELEEALSVVTNACIDFPDLSVPLCRMAELHYELKQFHEAIEAATRSIELDDTFHLPYRIRANAFYELEYYNDAYQDCCSCIDRYTGDIESYFCKINILIEVGQFEDAIEELNELEEQVQGTQITFLRGKALEASGKMKEAYQTYHSVLETVSGKDREIYPPAEVKSTAGVYFRLAQVCRALYQGNSVSVHQKECMDVLREGVRKHPADLDLLSDLAGELYIQSHHRDAQRFYERLAELDPIPLRYAHLAGNEIQMDEFDAALRHLQHALDMDPDLIYGHILLGAVHTCREDYDTALQILQNAESLAACSDQAWPRILQDQSMIYARMGKMEQAIAVLEENYRLYQKPDDYAGMLELYRMMGRFEEAVRLGLIWLQEHPKEDRSFVLDEVKLSAISLGDENTLMACSEADTRAYYKHLYLGQYLMFSDAYGSETPEKALHHCLEAEKADPTSVHNLLQISKLYLKLGNREKALEYAEKVLLRVPDDFMDSGYQRSYFLARSAEALAILGRFDEADRRIHLALTGRKCDFCQYGGCLDAYCALVYICCMLGDETGAVKHQQEGLAISPYDYDLLQYPKYFLKKEDHEYDIRN